LTIKKRGFAGCHGSSKLRPSGRFRYPTLHRVDASFFGLNTKIAAFAAASSRTAYYDFDVAKIGKNIIPTKFFRENLSF